MIFEEIINTYNTYLYSRSVMIDTKQFGDNHSLVLNIWSKNFVYWGYFVMFCLGYVLREISLSLHWHWGSGIVGQSYNPEMYSQIILWTTGPLFTKR